MAQRRSETVFFPAGAGEIIEFKEWWMRTGNRELIVVGDRLLIKADRPEDRTEVGLYLPQTAIEKEKIQSGYVVATGPGVALPEPAGLDDEEPWRESERRARYIPTQAEVGDYALFLKKSAVEIRFDNQDYLVVPQAGILVLMRDLEH
jgi:co-chaperonin GroES (HSP10)